MTVIEVLKRILQALRRPVIKGNSIELIVGTDRLVTLNENLDRVYLLVQNNGGLNLYVSFGAPQGGVRIAPAGYFEIPDNCINNSVYLYTLAGTVNASIVEGVRVN